MAEILAMQFSEAFLIAFNPQAKMIRSQYLFVQTCDMALPKLPKSMAP